MKDLDKILSHKLIDIGFLKKLIKKTKIFPGTIGFRLLLNSLTCVKSDHDTQIFILKEKYSALVKFSLAFYLSDENTFLQFDNLLKKTKINLKNQAKYLKDHKWANFHYPLTICYKTAHQIHIDIKRIHSQFKFKDNIDISYLYFNILILISHRRFKLGYVQGMADFLIPFVVEFTKKDLCTAESSAYFCYLELIYKVEFNISNYQQNLILRFREELENIDPVLYSFLIDIELDFSVFSFRWFNCLFFREFPYNVYIRIFSVMLCYKNLNNFLIYFAVSLLTFLRKDIIEKDYTSIVLLLQDLGNKLWTEKDVNELLSRAQKLYEIAKKQ